MPLFLIQHVPVISVLIVFAERMREVFAKREVVRGEKKESLTFNLFMLCGVAMVAGGISEYYLRGLALWWPTFIAGMMLAVASFLLRRAAIRSLGRFWSLHVEMREGHEFVQSGPFAYARHPVYLSMIFELLGTGLILNSWITLAAVFAVFIPTMLLRVRLEEAALIQQFGQPYRDYMREVPAIIPVPRRRKESR